MNITLNSVDYTVDKFHYSKDSDCFSAESSDLKLRYWPKDVKLRNPKTGVTVLFTFDKFDINYKGTEDEEIAGANYKVAARSAIRTSLLIIND